MNTLKKEQNQQNMIHLIIKLPAPGNFKATESNGKVTISWTVYHQETIGNPSHGKFGYSIYKDGCINRLDR